MVEQRDSEGTRPDLLEVASGISRAFKARERRENGCKGRKEVSAERGRSQQWLRVADSMFWTKGDPGTLERIIRGNMGKLRKTRCRVCWGKTEEEEEESEAVTGKSPVCYTFPD